MSHTQKVLFVRSHQTSQVDIGLPKETEKMSLFSCIFFFYLGL
jgi:hypothetical protein